ncbi:T3SS effector HopA1 family protein [Serinicoccus sediminis]|uniref:T3SS effector HopA1 family protein n=1 Tax=Serinicoccus sediminis TaxID=2306021 RepID=UPI00101ECFFF|nr:T3SS effector HopA1 family protein [Serinicoccus sediminis]
MSGVAAALQDAARVAAAGPAGEDPRELADRLYAQWYAAPVTPAVAEAPGPPLAGLLDARTLTLDGWTSATVRRVDAAGGLVVRDPQGRHHAVLPGRWARPSGGAGGGTSLPPRDGQQVLVPPVGGPVVAESWWRTWSPGWVHPAPAEPLTRVYLCVRRDALVHVVGRVVEVLVGLGGPWLLKCAVDAGALVRPDRVVAYLPDRDAPAAVSALAGATRGWLEPRTPPLTEAPVPGLAWAQDDGDGASFGENRCAALAPALAAWHSSGQRADGEHAARRGLREAGLDDRRPHLRRVGVAG